MSQDGDPAVEALTADRNPDQVTKKIGWLPYVLSGFSFIPAIGVFFGLIVIIVGIIERKIGGWKLVAIGSLGILVTLAPYANLFYRGYIERGGVFDDLSKQLAETQLTNLVKHIEYYKIISGRYPSSLEDLQPKNKYDVTGLVFIADPMNKKLNPLKKAIYFYDIINNGTHYRLFSSGIDCVPFTADDVHPNISLAETQKIGYRKKQQ